MDPFLKMDIFFFVTTLVVVIIGGIGILIMIKLWRILGHIERIVEMAEEETELIRDDIADIRSDVRHRGFSIFSLWRFVRNLIKRSRMER